MTSCGRSDDITLFTGDLVGDESSKPFSVHVVAATDPAASLATMVENEVFLRRFGNTGAEMEAEYGPYHAASRFLLAVDNAQRRPVGVIRLIVPLGVSLKLFNDVEAEPWNANRQDVLRRSGLKEESTWEVGTLAVSRHKGEHSSFSLLRPALYHALFVYSCLMAVEHWVAIIDDAVLNQLLLPFGIPFQPLADLPSRPYLGSPGSSPVVAHVPSVAAGVRAAGEDFFRLLVEGQGLTDVIVFPDWELLGGYRTDG